MPLDRQSIEKRDFPIGRRGYEPEAVDAHLATVAAELDSLQRSSRRRSTESLAQAASEQVRTIVEAAENSAADIERQADEEAERIRTDAQRDAQKAREEAAESARGHVGKVSEATALMMQRVEAMESELGALVESLRTGANRLNADLSLLEGNMGELYSAAGTARPASGGGSVAAPVSEPFEPQIEAQTPEPAAPDSDDVAQADDGLDDRFVALAAELDEEESIERDPEPAVREEPVERAEPPVAAPAAPAPQGDDAGDAGDVEGARLIALNMALNGQSREETDRYLAENFDLGDRAGLLDEVYSSVDG